MKIKNLNKKTTIAAICGAVLVFILIVLCSTSDWRARRSLKHECGLGMDCTCFSNVVDNRLSKEQINAFRKFLNSAKRRPTTSILEFTDEASAQRISQAVALCRPTPAQPQQQDKSKSKK